MPSYEGSQDAGRHWLRASMPPEMVVDSKYAAQEGLTPGSDELVVRCTQNDFQHFGD